MLVGLHSNTKEYNVANGKCPALHQTLELDKSRGLAVSVRTLITLKTEKI